MLFTKATNRDLHEVLHEDLMGAWFINNLHPGDTVGALTFVKNLEENVGGDLESVTIRTIGVKNIDVAKDLQGVPFPSELFTMELPRRSAVERICAQKCPLLTDRVVSVLDRRVLRQTPRVPDFLL